MSIKDTNIRKGMTKHQINELISEWILLEDDIYLGNKYKHHWKCKCGGTFCRTWDKIKGRIDLLCKECKYNKIEQRYKYEVERDGEYEYIRSYKKGDILPNGKIAKTGHMLVKHLYCNSEYLIQTINFINVGQKCSRCCGSYEKSFAHHIEVELELKLEDIWDFEKNTVNPYHIRKGTDSKVWIKCQEKGYHGSYEVSCVKFVDNRRCPYCSRKNGKVHPKDSFAQYHIDNTDKDFLEKYWDWDKNILNPWEIAPMSDKKVWIKCQNEEINKLNGLMKKEYHGSCDVTCGNFTLGERCGFCSARPNKVHPYDSFGYHNFDKVTNWNPNNGISPFRVAKSSNKKYKFVCYECFTMWKATPNKISKGQWCPTCSVSKGEKKIKSWLDKNNINYVHDEPYFEDLLSDKGNPLRPDFILPDHKIWIEYDGEFHYKDFFRDGRLSIQKEYDELKNEYAKKHGWKMIRIPYWDFDDIEEILSNLEKQKKFVGKSS